MVADQSLRLEYLGIADAQRQGTSFAHYAVLELVGRSESKGIGKLDVSSVLNISPKDLQYSVRRLSEEGLIERFLSSDGVEPFRNQKPTAGFHVLVLKRFIKYSTVLITHDEEEEVEGVPSVSEEELNGSLHLIRSIGEFVPESGLKSFGDRKEIAKRHLLATGTIHWGVKSSFLQYMYVSQENSLYSDVFSMDSGCTFSHPKQTTDHSLLYRIYEVVLDSKEKGTTARAISERIGVKIRFVSKTLTNRIQHLVTRKSDRKGKRMEYRYYVPSFCDRSQSKRYESPLKQLRRHWILDIVSSVGAIAQRQLVLLLMERESCLEFVIDKKSLKNILVGLEKDGKLKLEYIQVTSTRSECFVYINRNEDEIENAVDRFRETLSEQSKYIGNPLEDHSRYFFGYFRPRMLRTAILHVFLYEMVQKHQIHIFLFTEILHCLPNHLLKGLFGLNAPPREDDVNESILMRFLFPLQILEGFGLIKWYADSLKIGSWKVRFLSYSEILSKSFTSAIEVFNLWDDLSSKCLSPEEEKGSLAFLTQSGVFEQKNWFMFKKLRFYTWDVMEKNFPYGIEEFSHEVKCVLDESRVSTFKAGFWNSFQFSPGFSDIVIAFQPFERRRLLFRPKQKERTVLAKVKRGKVLSLRNINIRFKIIGVGRTNDTRPSQNIPESVLFESGPLFRLLLDIIFTITISRHDYFDPELAWQALDPFTDSQIESAVQYLKIKKILKMFQISKRVEVSLNKHLLAPNLFSDMNDFGNQLMERNVKLELNETDGHKVAFVITNVISGDAEIGEGSVSWYPHIPEIASYLSIMPLNGFLYEPVEEEKYLKVLESIESAGLFGISRKDIESKFSHFLDDVLSFLIRHEYILSYQLEEDFFFISSKHRGIWSLCPSQSFPVALSLFHQMDGDVNEFFAEKCISRLYEVVVCNPGVTKDVLRETLFFLSPHRIDHILYILYLDNLVFSRGIHCFPVI